MLNGIMRPVFSEREWVVFYWLSAQCWSWMTIICPYLLLYVHTYVQGFSHDLETGCPKLAIVKFLGVQNFKGDQNILRFQP